MEEARYQVKIEVFEGPMDLLLHLVKKNEVEIYDIPIAVITEQYLSYIEWLQSMNIDLAGDFLVMAATLMHIKSRMLLPAHEEAGEEEDPRMQIARPLMEYMRIREAAKRLEERDVLGESVFLRAPEPPSLGEGDGQPLLQVGLFELIEAFQRILAANPDQDGVTFSADTLSVKDRIAQIADILEQRRTVTFTELFEPGAPRAELVVTLLALLEMVRVGIIRLVQYAAGGLIRVLYA